MANEDVFGALAAKLNEYGLSQLFTFEGGNPGGWLYQQMQAGVDTPDEFEAVLENTDVWRTRFGGIVEQRKQAAAGKPVYVMTPHEMVQYETEAAQLMRRWQIPATFYDTREDLQALAVKGISMDELNERIEQGYATVQSASPEIRAKFAEYYGPQGDGALAAFYLDPERSMKSVQRSMAAATIGGTASLFGLAVNKGAAERLSDIGFQGGEIRSGLQQSGQWAPLFDESISETTDLTREKEGMAAAMGVDLTTGQLTDQAAANRALEKRAKQRQAAFSGGGGAVAGRAGIAGSGIAE